MYSDNSLTPRETIRLCVLGTLAQHAHKKKLTYDDLVNMVRHFVSRITGPSLELMGESIELLKYEGLILENHTSNTDSITLSITKEGMKILNLLLLANVRPGTNDLSELIIATKFRFLHLLPLEDQGIQVETFITKCEVETARLEDLLDYHKDDNGYIGSWLTQQIETHRLRLSWLRQFCNDIKKHHLTR